MQCHLSERPFIFSHIALLLYSRAVNNITDVFQVLFCFVQNLILIFYVWVSVHHKLIYIKRINVMHLGSTFICNCNIALQVSDALCDHLQEHLETVVTASGE